LSIINRITTWTSQILTSASLNGEFNNVVNTLNNLDAGTTSWDVVKSASFLKGSATARTILQIQQGTTNLQTTTGSATFVSTSLAVTITPYFSASTIRIFVTGSIENTAGGSLTFVTVYRGATELSGTANGFTATASGSLVPCSIIILDSPASTSALTYTVKIRANANTAVFGDGTMNHVILAEEIG
jgi:hypothetical protein